ncbi:MAG: helix-turn-helix transcriptional regulator [Alphaproteobacteria bacterium]|nr:helix-turn-helix transcriptional regulator [Alphaproteobacteria bacterium]
MMCWQRAADYPPILTFKSDCDAEYLRKYGIYYYKIDPWVRAGMNTGIILDEPWVGNGDVLVPHDALPASEFYQDFLLPYDQCHLMVAATESTNEILASYSFFRPPQGPRFDGNKLNDLLALAPHLKRASIIYRQTSELRARSGLFESSFNELAAAVFLLAENGRVLEMNASAKRLIDAPGSQQTLACRNGFLHAQLSSDDMALAKALQPVAELAPPSGLVLHEPCPAASLKLDITPLAPGSMPLWLDINQRPQSVIMLTATPLIPAIPVAERLVEGYDLTHAEAEVTLLLIAGLSPTQISARHNKSINTIKAQIKQIYAKTGVNGHAALVAHFMGGGT